MKIIAFSDVHGNQYAFREFMKVLKKRKFDFLIFCGDIHGYYYGQDEIIAQMKTMEKLYAVRGNHDEMAIQVFDGKIPAERLFEKYGHSYHMLKKENIDYVRQLPLILEMEIDGASYGIMHGTPKNLLEDRLYPKDEIDDEKLFEKYDYIFCGHTHFQMVKQCGNTVIMNAGSVGQQRDGKGFCFLEFDTETKTAEYIKIVYDRKSLETEIRKYDPDNEKMITILYRGEI